MYTFIWVCECAGVHRWKTFLVAGWSCKNLAQCHPWNGAPRRACLMGVFWHKSQPRLSFFFWTEAMEGNSAAFPADPTHHFHVALLDQRRRLRGQIAHLHKAARKLNQLRTRSLVANVGGSTLTAAGALTAILGLSLSPATLGASLLASAVGLGLATAGGAVSITSDLSLVLCNSRELRKVQEIAVTCRKQMREILGCLEFLRRGQGPGDPALRQSEKRASISLYNSVCFVVFCGSHSLLVPECTKEVTKVSQAVLKAKIQKLADNLETCTRAMDEVCDLLESRTELSPSTRRLSLGAKSTAETLRPCSWNCFSVLY